MKSLLKECLKRIKKNPNNIILYEDMRNVCIETSKTDAKLAVEYAKILWEVSDKALDLDWSGTNARKLYNICKRMLLLAAPYDLDSYLLYVEWNRAPEKKFYPPRRKVLRVLVQDLQDLYEGKIDFLGVSMPP